MTIYEELLISSFSRQLPGLRQLSRRLPETFGIGEFRAVVDNRDLEIHHFTDACQEK